MPYGYRGLKIFTALALRFQDFQRMKLKKDEVGDLDLIAAT
jgi:hypothetical protein